MLESDKVENIQDINPSILSFDSKKEGNLKEKLLNTSKSELNEINDKSNNVNRLTIEETAFSEKEDITLSIQENIQNPQTEVNIQKEEEQSLVLEIEEDKLNQKISFTIEKEDEESYNRRESSASYQIGIESKIFSESFQNKIKEEGKTNQKKEREEKINIFQGIILFIKVFFGLGLTCVSMLILYYTYLDEKHFDGIKFISLIIEPTIILISLVGSFPKKSSSFKKIVSALYLWALLLLIPFSFLSKAYIKIDKISLLLQNILIGRVSLLIFQIIIHFIIVIYKMPF